MSQASEPSSTSAPDVDDEETSHLERWPCHRCGDRDHTIFECEEAEERREENREPEAALRLDPVVRYDGE